MTPERAATCFSAEPVVAVEQLGEGGVHGSWKVTRQSGSMFVLQRLNSDMACPGDLAVVRRNHERLLVHLRGKSDAYPGLVPSIDGAHAIQLEGSWWRAFTYIRGVSAARYPTSRTRLLAGRILGQFHINAADLPLGPSPVPVFDFDLHLARLKLVDDHAVRTAVAQVERFGGAALPLGELSASTLHSDPKLANILLTGPDDGVLIDYDTCGHGTLILDLADAMRSWCRDTSRRRLQLAAVEDAARGYAQSGRTLTPTDLQHLGAALARISATLAARYLCDAVEQRYFVLRPGYADLRSQNLALGSELLEFCRDVTAESTAISRIWRSVLEPAPRTARAPAATSR